jgi:hypothetical protein
MLNGVFYHADLFFRLRELFLFALAEQIRFLDAVALVFQKLTLDLVDAFLRMRGFFGQYAVGALERDDVGLAGLRVFQTGFDQIFLFLEIKDLSALSVFMEQENACAVQLGKCLAGVETFVAGIEDVSASSPIEAVSTLLPAVWRIYAVLSKTLEDTPKNTSPGVRDLKQTMLVSAS